MLVLKPRESQRIQIGNDILISVLSCGRNRVTLGFDAPKDQNIKFVVPLARKEVKNISDEKQVH